MRNFSNNDRSRRPQGGRGNDRRDSGRSRDRFDSRNSGRSNRMYDAVCADCGDDCKVPFMPSSGKPVYCSNCFEKRGNGNGDSGRDSRRPSFSNRNNRSSRDSRPARNSRPQKDYDRQFEAVNVKLDKILKILVPEEEIVEAEVAAKEIIETEVEAAVEENVVAAETEVEAAVEEKTV